jgi:hypothetical protein
MVLFRYNQKQPAKRVPDPSGCAEIDDYFLKACSNDVHDHYLLGTQDSFVTSESKCLVFDNKWVVDRFSFDVDHRAFPRLKHFSDASFILIPSFQALQILLVCQRFLGSNPDPLAHGNPFLVCDRLDLCVGFLG